MGKNKKFIIGCFFAFYVQLFVGKAAVSGDSLFVRINQSYFDGQHIEIPVVFAAQGPVISLDLAFRFDVNRLQFDNVTNTVSGLQYLFYLNPVDSVWRLTSYHPAGLLPSTPVFNLRFLALNNEACAYDFSDQEGFLNGDSCYTQVIGCMNNTGFGEQDETKDVGFFPNPFSSHLNITAPEGTTLRVYGANGQLVATSTAPAYLNALMWPDGVYFLHVVDRLNVRMFKLLKCQ